MMKLARRSFLKLSLESFSAYFLLSAASSSSVFPTTSLAKYCCNQCGFSQVGFDIGSINSQSASLEHCPNCGAENYLRHSDPLGTCNCVTNESKMGIRPCCAVPFASQAAGAKSGKPHFYLAHLQF